MINRYEYISYNLKNVFDIVGDASPVPQPYRAILFKNNEEMFYRTFSSELELNELLLFWKTQYDATEKGSL